MEDGQYVKRDDFLAFVAGAAPTKPGVSAADRARSWLRRQGVKDEIAGLSPATVSRLITAAQKVIVAKHGRKHGEISATTAEAAAIPGLAGEEPPEEQ